MKSEGKKKEQAPYKIVLNATYGICKDKYSQAYDPRQANNVCINGQLMLLDLLEKLEGHCTLIQSNTDGLIIQIPDTDKDFEIIDDICYEWENRTNMSLGFDIITEIYQKDVNNYVFIDNKQEVERKGSYVKSLSKLDNDLPIINKSLIDYMVNKIPIEVTINNCDDLLMFQKICKITNKYKYLLHGEKALNEKTIRVFASIKETDKGIYKLHKNKEKPDKFPNTPEQCFIENGDVKNKKVPDYLDIKWYIDLAYKRLKDFGFKY